MIEYQKNISRILLNPGIKWANRALIVHACRSDLFPWILSLNFRTYLIGFISMKVGLFYDQNVIEHAKYPTM